MHETSPFGSCRTPTCRTRPGPGYADRGLCGFCETAGREAVAELAADWEALQPLIWDKPAGGFSLAGTRTPPGPTEPVHLATDALARAITVTVLGWEQVVRRRARLSTIPATPCQPGWDVSRACLILNSHFAALLATPPTELYDPDGAPVELDGPDAIVELTALHRRARARIGMTTFTTALPAACHACGWPQLRHRAGSDDVHCPRCRTHWPWNLYQEVQERALFGGAR